MISIIERMFTPNRLGFLSHISPVNFSVPIREASKKSSSSTRNKGNARRKFRGILIQDGTYVQKGAILVLQNNLNFFPGVNVGFGRNGTLCALVRGTVRVSSEKPDLNMDHTWVVREFGGRNNENLYKKYFNVVPDKEHSRFKLIDKI